MPATVTLTQTMFTAPVAASDSIVQMASLTGIYPGVRMFSNAELMGVDRLTGINNGVVVRRGLDGTATKPHSTAETVYIGRADQFYTTDPTGIPSSAVPVLPHINISEAEIWMPQGDEVGPGAAARTWQQVLTYQEAGALGVRVNQTSLGSGTADPVEEQN